MMGLPALVVAKARMMRLPNRWALRHLVSAPVEALRCPDSEYCRQVSPLGTAPSRAQRMYASGISPGRRQHGGIRVTVVMYTELTYAPLLSRYQTLLEPTPRLERTSPMV